MSKRKKKSRCPMCGRALTTGITRSLCPVGHYEVAFGRQHNEVMGRLEVVPVERFVVGAFVVTIDHERGMDGASVQPSSDVQHEASDG